SGQSSVLGRVISLAGGLLEPLGKKNVQKLIDGLKKALAYNRENLMASKSVAKKLKRKTSRGPSANGAQAAPAKWVGQPIRRKEENRLVSGRGIFVDDEKMPGMLHIKFVRSSYPHAKIARLDVSQAEKFPGVVCTLTGAEIKKQVQPFIEIGPGGAQKIADYPMAVGKVVFQGEHVAAVVAVTRLAAEDAAELVEVDYEPLQPVVTAAT